jgi:hypothetical protein
VSVLGTNRRREPHEQVFRSWRINLGGFDELIEVAKAELLSNCVPGFSSHLRLDEDRVRTVGVELPIVASLCVFECGVDRGPAVLGTSCFLAFSA